jgi:subtilisin
MLWRPRRVFTFFAAALIFALSTAGAASAIDRPVAEQRVGYIVVFRDFVNERVETDVLERAHAFRSDFRYGAALKGFAAKLTPTQAAAIERLPFVAIVSEDQTVQAIGPAALTASEVPTGVRRMEAATDTAAAAGSSTEVAVIDTGVNLTHPDLNVADGKNCISQGAAANDDNGHGTHVAGSIGAKNDNAGVVGVAAGTKIRAVKVLDRNGSGTWSQVICGIDYVTANAATIKVANMSLGGSGTTNYSCGESALHQAICNSTAAGVTYVVAAGNGNRDFWYDVPANYTQVLTVTAASDSDGKPGAVGGAPTCRSGEQDDRYASFSNFADPRFPADVAHAIAAPGVCIKSTYLNGGYGTMSGTSMASPHMAGHVALCISAGPCAGLAPAQIISRMRSDADAYNTTNTGYGFTGDPRRPVSGRYYGYLSSAKSYVETGPDTTAPEITSGPTAGSITTGGATITWATDEASDSTVEYGTASVPAGGTYPSSATGATSVTSHSVPLAELAASTKYFYVVKSKDSAGNTVTSAESTFTTATPDTTAPAITAGPTVGSITTSGATVTWSTDEASDSQVDYGTAAGNYTASSGVSQTSGVTSHSVSLSGLSASTTYYYVVRSKDAAGNTATSAESTFTTATPDTTAPVISAVAAGSITSGGATVTWTTDESSDSQVDYGTSSGGYSQSSGVSQTSGVTSHSVSLSGLSASTTYYYVVKSKDAAGNLATSGEGSFTTAASADTTAPTISNISVRDRTSTSARITWTTNESADTQVEFGKTTALGTFTPLDTVLVTSHSVTLTGLDRDTRYYFRVRSRDAAGNLTISSRQSFRTRD